METMGDRIKRLRLELGLTQEKLGEKVGLKRAAINKYEKGSIENMKRSTIEKMSKLFGISPLYLMCLSDSENEVSEIVKRTIDVMKQLQLSRQKNVLNYATSQLAEQQDNLLEAVVEFEYEGVKQSIDKNVINFVTCRDYEEGIPMRISVAKTSAGSGVMLYDDAEIDTIIFPEEEVYDDSPEVTGIIVKGDSMQPKYHDGDVLWVDSRCSVDHGQIGVFSVDGESYVKKKGHKKLISLNSKYEDILINEYTEFFVIGKVVDFTPREVFEQIEQISWKNKK